MNRLGDVPADVLFGLIALNNNLVAPAVIPAALRARALEPTRTLAELLVSQGALTPVQCDLVETLSGEYIERGGGDALKGLATLIANPSARERLDQLGDLGLPESLTHAVSLTTTLLREPDPRLDDPNHPLLPPTKIVPNSWPRVAGYQILEVLGSGGMGIVYKAHQERLDRFVALKMIRAGGGARPEDLARFETEAKAVAAIEHNNIVKIFDIGEQDGLPYFSLEYLPGGSLSQRIGGKPQPFDQAARIVETLARAIHVAHEHKVIHRDLKPANVLFAADGTLKITDFGLVKRLESDSKQTRSGSILGTPSYMAPEQARGESQTVGPAADQYALGAILYDLLTGRPPFQGTSVLDTLEMVRSKEPVPPSQLQPKTPRDLETICLKCLEKDVARRYPDVLALAEDLRRLQCGRDDPGAPGFRRRAALALVQAQSQGRVVERRRRALAADRGGRLGDRGREATADANAVAEDEATAGRRRRARGQRTEPKRGGSRRRTDCPAQCVRYVTCRRSRKCESRCSTRRSRDSRPRPRR